MTHTTHKSAPEAFASVCVSDDNKPVIEGKRKTTALSDNAKRNTQISNLGSQNNSTAYNTAYAKLHYVSGVFS